MGEALNDIKVRLINRITLLNDAKLLALLEKLLTASTVEKADLQLLMMALSVSDKTDLDELITLQKYQGPDRASLDSAVVRLNIQEPIDALLSQLKP